jgi:hypothetical protein
MSALGHKLPQQVDLAMSALPPKADTKRRFATISPESRSCSIMVRSILREAEHVRTPICPCRFHAHGDREGGLRLYEAGRTYALSRAIAHAASKRELVAKQRPADWMPPNIFQFPRVLTAAEVIEAEEELKALQLHAFAIVDPEVDA